MKEKEIELAQRSRMAGVLLGELGPYLNRIHDASLSRLKSLYRGGELDVLKANSLVAEMCAIENLEQSLRADILSGQKHEKEIVNGNSK